MNTTSTIENETERRPRIRPGAIKTCSQVAVAAILLSATIRAIAGYLSTPTFLPNGDLIIPFSGTPGRTFVAEWTESLISPATWTPLQTNIADSCTGVAIFTNVPAGSQKFYRVRHDSSAPIPLVYPCEHTGRLTPPPPLPTLGNLPIVQPLTDPFMWSASDPRSWSEQNGRSTNFDDWKRRRAEVKAEIENYEIGPKPYVDLTNVTASYVPGVGGGVLTVVVTRPLNEGPPNSVRTLTLTAQIQLPAGTGPFPAVIGMALAPGGGSGSLPSSIFTSRNIARIDYLHNQLTTYAAGQDAPKTNDQYYAMYPEYIYAGQYSAWSWGVSRLIDGLQKTAGSHPIDTSRLAVTGCSYAGKMALFAGALDERVALTIAQESGGGGAPAWRVSETLADVEKLGATDNSWFMQSMFQYSGQNVSRLPHDHHELLAMCAPRALLATGNTDFQWLANPSCYVSARAAHEVYKTFGIGDRFGFYIDGGHGHCAVPTSQVPAIESFVEKFLVGNTNANTDITVYPASYDYIDYEAWYQWWGTTNPVFPVISNSFTITFEPECETVGTNWQILTDTNASNGKYVTVTPGIQSLSAGPTNSWELITIPFTVTNTTSQSYVIYARCNNPTADDDSFWVKVDNGSFVMANGLVTSGWQWVSLGSYNLSAGLHTLTIGYREDGAKLDKISISDFPFAPQGTGEPAQNTCP